MRIAIGQFWQKTNSFNRNPTTWYDFQHWGISRGDELLKNYREIGEIGGFIEGCQGWKSPPEISGLLRLFSWPWGKIDAATWKTIREEFRGSLEEAMPLDGVLISLHGATEAEGESDACGVFLKMIREVIGEKVRLVVTVDLQANVTPLMMEQADLLIPSHTFPRLDQFETGRRASAALERLITESIQPHKWMLKIPMITPIETHNTFHGPPAELYHVLKEWEAIPELLACGLCMCHPWLDVPGLGWTLLLESCSPEGNWHLQLKRIADRCWELRHPLTEVARLNPLEAIHAACASDVHPVILADGGDATNCGATGDSTILLRELMKCRSIPRGALLFIVDPESVAAAMIAKEKGKFDSFVGATYAPEFSDPIRLRGTVERILDLRFTLDGHLGHHMPVNMGKAAVIQAGDVTVLLTERSGPGSSPQMYEAAGLDPRKFGIVVAKSPAGFRADYESFAGKIILTDGPGCATSSWSRLKFLSVSKPVWPLQEVLHMEDAKWCVDYEIAPASSA